MFLLVMTGAAITRTTAATGATSKVAIIEHAALVNLHAKTIAASARRKFAMA